MKTESRLLLRLSIQFDLQVPDLIRCCQAHRHSPVLSCFTNTPEARALPSPGVTRLHRYLWPFPTPRWSAALSGGVRGSRPRDHPGPPPLTLDYLSGMLCSLPRWTDSVRNGSCHGALPRRVLPDSFRLPWSCDRSASTLPLSRPARASHALRPARLLAHHTWTWSRGSGPPRFRDWPPASYRIQPSTIRVGPSPTGNQPLWGTRKTAGATASFRAAPRCCRSRRAAGSAGRGWRARSRWRLAASPPACRRSAVRGTARFRPARGDRPSARGG
jgi:hypothetical protein